MTLQPMIDAIRTAAALTRRILANGTHANTKGDDSPVTIADYGAQALICRAIQTHYPDCAVVAEESGTAFRELVSPEQRARVVALLARLTGEAVDEARVIGWLDYGQDRPTDRQTWVIDPIDGTVGYVNGRYYALCAALLENHMPAAAVIGLPRSPLDADGTILYAEGETLHAVGMDGGEPRRMHASTRTNPAEMVALDSYKIPQDELDLNADLRQRAGIGAASVELYDSQLKYAMVAAGYGDVFVRLPRDIEADPHYIWDHATGAALIRGGGGRLTDLSGNPLDFSQGKALPHTGFIATSGGAYHNALVTAVKARLGV